jgi:hypothetical protein
MPATRGVKMPGRPGAAWLPRVHARCDFNLYLRRHGQLMLPVEHRAVAAITAVASQLAIAATRSPWTTERRPTEPPCDHHRALAR